MPLLVAVGVKKEAVFGVRVVVEMLYPVVFTVVTMVWLNRLNASARYSKLSLWDKRR